MFLLRVECTGVKTCRSHRLVVLSLPKITSESLIASICYKHYWVWRIVVNGFANRIILRAVLNIAERLIMLREPFKLDPFVSEIRKHC